MSRSTFAIRAQQSGPVELSLVCTQLSAVAGAVLVALAIWTVAALVFGMDVRTPAFAGIPAPTPIGAFDLIVVSGLLSLTALASLAVLERLMKRGRQIWAIIAIVALVLSLGTPLSGTGIAAANRAVLLLIHLSVGGVLIPTLYWSSHRHTAEDGTR